MEQIKKLNKARTDFLEASLELIKKRGSNEWNIIDLSFSLRQNGATTWMIEMLKKYPNSVGLTENRFELADLKKKNPNLPFYLLDKDLRRLDLTDKIIFLDVDASFEDYSFISNGLILVRI